MMEKIQNFKLKNVISLQVKRVGEFIESQQTKI